MLKSVAVICEGKTERLFISTILQPYLPNLELRALEIGTCQGLPCSGGDVSFARFKKDFAPALEDYDHITTLFDYYGLGNGWPTSELPEVASNKDRVEELEQKVLSAMLEKHPEIEEEQFIPFFALHEFEALLFCDTQKMHEILRHPKELFDAVLQECGQPENINSHPDTAPSKRIEAIRPQFKNEKARKGIRIAEAVTIDVMRQQCPHFNAWIEKIEALTD